MDGKGAQECPERKKQQVRINLRIAAKTALAAKATTALRATAGIVSRITAGIDPKTTAAIAQTTVNPAIPMTAPMNLTVRMTHNRMDSPAG